jgi:hypothetical protein
VEIDLVGASQALQLVQIEVVEADYENVLIHGLPSPLRRY